VRKQYRVEFVRSARKELQSLPTGPADRILQRITALADNPRPAGCKKLRGPDGFWRMRVGDYRVVYLIDDMAAAVEIRIVRHRREAYS
jgi:mRNA interferase RelE/StbE